MSTSKTASNDANGIAGHIAAKPAGDDAVRLGHFDAFFAYSEELIS